MKWVLSTTSKLPEKTDDPEIFTVTEDAICETGLSFHCCEILLRPRLHPAAGWQTLTWREFRKLVDLFREAAPEGSPHREELTNMMAQINGPWGSERREYRLTPRNG